MEQFDTQLTYEVQFSTDPCACLFGGIIFICICMLIKRMVCVCVNIMFAYSVYCFHRYRVVLRARVQVFLVSKAPCAV